MCWLVSLFSPSLFGCRVLEYFINEKLEKRDLIFYYLFILLFTNSFSVVISNFLFGLATNLERALNNSPIFSVKYIFVSVFISVLLGFFISVFRKYISFSLEVTKNDNKKSKNKKNN